MAESVVIADAVELTILMEKAELERPEAKLEVVAYDKGCDGQSDNDSDTDHFHQGKKGGVNRGYSNISLRYKIAFKNA